MVLKKYLEWKERETGSKVINIEFRSKRQQGWGSGMVLTFANGRRQSLPMMKTKYGILYTKHCIQRPSCFVCRFRGTEKRWADVTIGDFWGIGRQGIPFEYERTQGISVVLPNSIKGRALFQSIAADTQNVMVVERTLDEVHPGNAWLTKNYGKRADYDRLFELLRTKPFEEAFKDYFA